MPRTRRAQTGDTLCGFAMEGGFLDCDPVRAANPGADFLNRPLRRGDRVVIPDPAPEAVARPVDAQHLHIRRNSPPVSVRLVHGSSNQTIPNDTTLRHLHVSNFNTRLAGPDGTAAFTNAFGFDADADADPDTFKVEVTDPLAGGGPVRVLLQALKPVYDARGRIERHEPFAAGDANAALRKIENLECQATATHPTRFRSRYLRLVTDEEDKNNAGFADQLLLVADLADGQNGDNDRLEILDQEVQASYRIPRCNNAASPCTVHASIPVGDGQRRLRVRWHMFETPAGSGNTVHGMTLVQLERCLRYRTFKWLRRILAQADIAPVLADPEIVTHDQPEDNLLTLSQDHGGVASQGTTLAFDLRTPAGVTNFALPLRRNETPEQVGGRVVANLPRGFRGRSFLNARGWNARRASCDVLITSRDGPVTIENPAINPVGTGQMTVEVARPGNLMNVTRNPTDNTYSFSTPDFRRILRSAERTARTMDLFVVGGFAGGGLNGQAFVQCRQVFRRLRPPLSLRNAVIFAFQAGNPILDISNTNIKTLPHELSHAVQDLVHVEAGHALELHQVLYTFGVVADSVDYPRRLNGAGPYMIPTQEYHRDGQRVIPVSAVERLRNQGATFLRGW